MTPIAHSSRDLPQQTSINCNFMWVSWNRILLTEAMTDDGLDDSIHNWSALITGQGYQNNVPHSYFHCLKNYRNTVYQWLNRCFNKLKNVHQGQINERSFSISNFHSCFLMYCYFQDGCCLPWHMMAVSYDVAGDWYEAWQLTSVLWMNNYRIISFGCAYFFTSWTHC